MPTRKWATDIPIIKRPTPTPPPMFPPPPPPLPPQQQAQAKQTWAYDRAQSDAAQARAEAQRQVQAAAQNTQAVAAGTQNWINPNGTINNTYATSLPAIIQHPVRQGLPRPDLAFSWETEYSKGFLPWRLVKWTKDLSPEFYHSPEFQKWYTPYFAKYQMGLGPLVPIPNWIQNELGYNPQPLIKDLPSPIHPGDNLYEQVVDVGKTFLDYIFKGPGGRQLLLVLAAP